MTAETFALLLAAGVGIVSAFVGYWLGVGAAERRLGPRFSELRARYACLMELNLDFAHQIAQMRQHRAALTADEAATFAAIVDNLRKDAR